MTERTRNIAIEQQRAKQEQLRAKWRKEKRWSKLAPSYARRLERRRIAREAAKNATS